MIASYRWPEALRLSLRSALRQTIPRLEVIVVEDGEDTASREVVDELGDARAVWHSLRPGSGSQAGPNELGRHLARAPVVAYLGHDDIWHPRHIAGLLAALTPEVEIVHSATCYLEEPSVVPAHETDPGVPAPASLGGGVLRLAGLDPWTPDTFVPPSSIAHRRDDPRIAPWPDPAATGWPLDYAFLTESRNRGARFASSGEATVFKVTAALRPDSYRTRNVDPQHRIVRALAADGELGPCLVGYALARGAERSSGAPGQARPGEIADQNRRMRGLPPVFCDRQHAWDAGRHHAGRGFHPVEHDVGGAFAWTDARTRTPIRLDPLPGAPPLRLRLTIRHVAASEQLDRLAVELDGVLVIPEREPSPADRIVFTFALSRAAGGEVVEVGLRVPPVVPAEREPASTDRRVLGVALARAELF